ncbi:Hcp family type VI secretion system effector [Chimaeribacter arupi]|uniref:Type VI secretion system tube protein Hcp n=1 Tax=Chimaeribacter arupi TaxID=2060066 RepID=A0A2N5EIY4_9GAMM|nr:type VI secretion system tube protein TssD [Chimaeribacter arupi]PLR45211.1 type VI secretion system tube protein Hcp [Chimaeribacter arupi]PLR47464.1 type VI secretion system tube protein Hcp [Chimaeribacter arupi]
MSIPAHIWFEDENGSPIVGPCLLPKRVGSIEMRSFSHNVNIPVDPHRGKLTGTRIHTPVVFQKEADQTTPILFRALCEGRKLKSSTIKMYRILDAGIEMEYLNIFLENVIITSMSPLLYPNSMAETHLENIELRYEKITLKYTEGNIMYTDSWNEYAIA